MGTPGFTADASFYRTTGSYRLAMNEPRGARWLPIGPIGAISLSAARLGGGLAEEGPPKCDTFCCGVCTCCAGGNVDCCKDCGANCPKTFTGGGALRGVLA